MYDITFNRPHLASAYCDSIAGQGIANARSGLFLAAPRRVGKSTFLNFDLVPEIETRQWLPIYVDLWANKQLDPALTIIETIKNKMLAYKNQSKRFKSHLKISQLNLFQLITLNFQTPGLPQSVTLVDCLKELSSLTKKPLVLIIDEAQHALASADGMNVMFALKSARDQMSYFANPPNLMLVMTGSNRDKLSQLVIKKDQPFFGAFITTFPPLGKEYTDFLTHEINQSLTKENQFNENSMWQAFQKLGYRPELLRQIVDRIAVSGQAASLGVILKRDVKSWQNTVWSEYAQEFNQLTVLQQAVLVSLIENAVQWSPFSEDALVYYKDIIRPQKKLTHSHIQAAIKVLREHGLVWQSNRGAYAIEDEGFVEWYKSTKQTKKKSQTC